MLEPPTLRQQPRSSKKNSLIKHCHGLVVAVVAETKDAKSDGISRRANNIVKKRKEGKREKGNEKIETFACAYIPFVSPFLFTQLTLVAAETREIRTQ